MTDRNDVGRCWCVLFKLTTSKESSDDVSFQSFDRGPLETFAATLAKQLHFNWTMSLTLVTHLSSVHCDFERNKTNECNLRRIDVISMLVEWIMKRRAVDKHGVIRHGEHRNELFTFWMDCIRNDVEHFQCIVRAIRSRLCLMFACIFFSAQSSLQLQLLCLSEIFFLESKYYSFIHPRAHLESHPKLQLTTQSLPFRLLAR